MSSAALPVLLSEIRAAAEGLPPLAIMEVCGTHTVSIFRAGLKDLLPSNVKLLSGPGCPVCVTSQGYIDAACELAARGDVTICTYGDMVRVPGAAGSLERQRAQGARVVVVYSARDAVRYAAGHPAEQVVFLAVGFETTAPATAAAVLQAQQQKLTNFSILGGHKRVMPALEALLAAGDVPIDGFLCPGHVSVVIGPAAYAPIADRYGKPCVVTGFEPVPMLRGIARVIAQCAGGQAAVENVYSVAVPPGGNAAALACLDKVFTVGDETWRALGVISQSGLVLRRAFAEFDAAARFALEFAPEQEPAGCRCGEVIQGKLEPPACALFAQGCTPLTPVGPCMVSSEGTCAAWYKYNPASRRGAAVEVGGE